MTLRILSELGLVRPNDDVVSVLQPNLIIESAHVTAQCFGGIRRRRVEHLRTNVLIVKQSGFLGHHEVFGCWVMLPLDNEPVLEPLAEARRGDDMFAPLVPPEKRETQIFSRVETGTQFFAVVRVVQ